MSEYSREGGQTPGVPGQGQGAGNVSSQFGERTDQLADQAGDTLPADRPATGQVGEDASARTRRYDQARERASEIGHKAQQRAEQGKEKAATGMHRAADRIRERGSGSEGLAGQASSKAASGMDKAADYLKDHNTDEMLKDAERYAKDHPGQAILGAAVAGFLLGKILL
jgi:ElaB/YqjD/DUF883 family membrane-anchored ribosome-binding protein